MKVEKRRQISMIDAHRYLLLYDGFGVKRHAGSGQLQHAQVIGAISNGHDILRREAARGCELVQRGDFGFTA